MKLIQVLLFTTLRYNVAFAFTDEEYDLIRHLENDFSPDTFAHFNVSKNYRKFDLSEVETLSRRWDLFWYRWWAPEQLHTNELNQRACFLISNTYVASMEDLRRYFHIRFLYVNTLDYEMGYMIYDIVHRYQMLVEIYQIMVVKYAMRPNQYRWQIKAMLYFYRNMLEYSTAIMHLCNMLHEVEAKYEGHPLGVWDDYPQSEEVKEKIRGNGTKGEKHPAVADYERRREEERKRRRRERRRDRKKMNMDDYKLTTPRRRPKKSFWPLHYGWSIEYW